MICCLRLIGFNNENGSLTTFFIFSPWISFCMENSMDHNFLFRFVKSVNNDIGESA